MSRRADGSTAQVVTLVAHAVNEAGRDQLTSLRVRPGGRSRILHAFAVDPAGYRREASSIRGGVVRFRQLDVGSRVVLQYRFDARPEGYLTGHVARQWWFQQARAHTTLSRWVLWLPAGTPLEEWSRGDIERTEERRGDQVRVAWAMSDVPPVIREPAMPTLQESTANLVVSTIADWQVFWKWEEALLRDAFRQSPDVVETAEALFAELGGVEDNPEKIRRILDYLITRIRYQQDYEGAIAGVKPHAAAVVLARQYGDCKDKAVLFITLARLAGIEAHFALVRTRDVGPVIREVPMQQFNHAIVYVPEQDGVAEGRFYDPTVDALDVDVLRHDDQGTWSLVLDPMHKSHTWRRIPFQAPGLDRVDIATSLDLTWAGSANGRIAVSARGRAGETFRRAARNPEHLKQVLQQQIGSTYSGGRLLAHTLDQVSDIRRPAALSLTFDAPSVARLEGDALRMKVPISWSPAGWFNLVERRHSMLLGAPRTMTWKLDIALPEGARLRRVPPDSRIAASCLEFERTFTPAEGRVTVDQTVRFVCERVAVEAYAEHRVRASEMVRAIEEELVVQVPKTRGTPVARRAKGSLRRTPQVHGQRRGASPGPPLRPSDSRIARYVADHTSSVVSRIVKVR